jgi:hypothetical protein
MCLTYNPFANYSKHKNPAEEEIQMTDVRSATQDFQEQILDTIRKSQEAVTDAIRTWAETVIAATSPVLTTGEGTAKKDTAAKKAATQAK